MFSLAVLVSGSGSNLQSIIDAIDKGYIKAKISIVIADRDCYALERAEKRGIKTLLLSRACYKEDLSNAILDAIGRVDLIVLCGYLSILQGTIVEKYHHKIINIHPALLPKFGGKGMYGLKVHEAVLCSGDKITGPTVHFVDEETDHGPIIKQKSVPVLKGDTAEILQKRVLTCEHEILVEVIKELAEKKELD